MNAAFYVKRLQCLNKGIKDVFIIFFNQPVCSLKKTNPSCVNHVQLEPTSLYVCKHLANQAVSDSKCRVDGKEMISVPQRRLSFDCKTSKPVFTQQSDIISHTTSHDDMEKVFLYLLICSSETKRV